MEKGRKIETRENLYSDRHRRSRGERGREAAVAVAEFFSLYKFLFNVSCICIDVYLYGYMCMRERGRERETHTQTGTRTHARTRARAVKQAVMSHKRGLQARRKKRDAIRAQIGYLHVFSSQLREKEGEGGRDKYFE